MNSIESQSESKFIHVAGKKVSDTIKNSHGVIVTDIHKERILHISSEQLDSLKSYVTNDSSYIFDMQKRCLFVPQLSFEFTNSPHVTLFVSMICNQVKIVSGEKSIILDYDLIKDDFNSLIENLIKNTNK